MTLSPDARAALLEAMVTAAVDAGAVIRTIYDAGFVVETKADDSPVTAADRAGEAVILEALAAAAPGVPIVAEEECAEGRTPAVNGTFFLVDALDGTKEFIVRSGDFTVNIALVEAGVPTLGVVYAPARGRLFAGDLATGAAWTADQWPDAPAGARRPIAVRAPGATLVAVASRSHDSAACEAYLARLAVNGRVTIGSSLKFCLIAEGAADLYPRMTPTMEWDTAAGHAVLSAAGGRVFAPDGQPLGYGKSCFYNPGFVASGPFTPPPLA